MMEINRKEVMGKNSIEVEKRSELLRRFYDDPIASRKAMKNKNKSLYRKKGNTKRLGAKPKSEPKKRGRKKKNGTHRTKRSLDI